MKGLRIFFIVFGVVVVLAVIGAINRLITDGTVFTNVHDRDVAKYAAPQARASNPTRLCSMVITDEEMEDWQWGVRNDIARAAKVQAFLEERKSILADQERFGLVPAAFITEAAKKFKINPLVILVTLQKEQGLITQRQYNPASLAFAMGYGKPSSLWEQIANGTAQFRRYLDAPWNYNFKAGIGRETQDGVMMWPQNTATAALYNYTPYAGKRCGGSESVGGVGLFLQLWQDWSGWKP